MTGPHGNELTRSSNEGLAATRLFPQVVTVVAAWLLLVLLHWGNDGLWFFDAPGHAVNGFFWKDYLLEVSLEPKGYALSYFARYPIINPVKHPPVFYLLEAVLFGSVGPSPYLAKGLVLAFTLVAAMYTVAWCRRWLAAEAGWAGVLFILLPGISQWSHAVMLNIPTVALGISALYHLRRWMEGRPDLPTWRHLYLGAALTVLAILTYVTSTVLVFIAAVWLIVERRWRLLWNKKTLVTAALSGLALLPWFLVVMHFEPNRIEGAIGNSERIANVSSWAWSYYFNCLPDLFGPHLLALAVVGAAGGLFIGRHRNETIRLLIMAAICFVFFSYVPEREARYMLLIALPLAILATQGPIFAIHRL